MALFTDGPASTIDRLTEHDSSLLELAATESINLTTKLVLAYEEIGLEISSLFQRAQSPYSLLLTATPLDLAHLVVTPAVKMWHTYHALTMVYRDAYYNQFNERYKGKWTEYQSLSLWAKNKVMETGFGLVLDPVPLPDQPLLSLAVAAENSGTFYFSVTYLNAATEEGAPSSIACFSTLDGTGVNVSPVNLPANICSWNLYAGTTPSALFLQNTSPIDPNEQWTYYPSSAQISGKLPGSGQSPNLIKTLPRILQRG